MPAVYSMHEVSDSGGAMGIFVFLVFASCMFHRVLVAPRHLERDAFFLGSGPVTAFHEVLKGHEKVSQVQVCGRFVLGS